MNVYLGLRLSCAAGANTAGTRARSASSDRAPVKTLDTVENVSELETAFMIRSSI
jgi:hypothetical protein